jgi:hypothetical protein
MPRTCLGTVSVLLLLALAAPQPAGADPVLITGGYLAMGSSRGDIDLIGQQGFRFAKPMSSIGGLYGPGECRGCRPGDILSLTSHWSGKDLGGIVSFRGDQYPIGGFQYLPNSLLIQFNGSVPVPAVAGDVVTLVAPFTFSGTFTFSPDLSQERHARVTLMGLGTATVRLTAMAGDGLSAPYWEIHSSRYDFAPIPEPATLLLVGGGAVAAALARRRVRRPR